MALFKDGGLTYHDLMYGMTKKQLFELRDARVERLHEEQEELKREQEQQQRDTIRESILQR